MAMNHLLALLPEKMSPNGEKAFRGNLINEKMGTNDVTTTIAAECTAFAHPVISYSDTNWFKTRLQS